MPTKITTEILTAAVLGFEEQKRRIDLQIAEIRQMLDGGTKPTAATPEVPKGKRRKMSTGARKRIGDAQRKRWAESKKQSESPSSQATSEALKPKRKLSRAGRAAIIAATKKRFALKRAEAEKAAPKKIVRKKVVAKNVAVQAPAKATKKAVKKSAAKKPQNAVTKVPAQTVAAEAVAH